MMNETFFLLFESWGQNYISLIFLSLFFPTDNVALHMPSYQRYPFDKGNVKYDAANAVDGLKSNLSFHGGQCVVSAQGHETAIWRVDLGSVHYIDHITLYFLTENNCWGNYLIIVKYKQVYEKNHSLLNV